ncbi:MAG TPA: MarR family winged helix-turn-helix transcriptional regulator, partial [Solirubrobacteraceae bacterium]
LAIDLSVASRQVAALCEAGYVRRDQDTDDRRAYIVSITDAGHRVLAESHRRMVEAFDAAIGPWPERQVRTLSRGLARLREDHDIALHPGARERAA